jgi:cytochrome b561
MLLSQAEGRAVGWFGLLELPVLLEKNKELAERLEDMHEAGFNLMMVLLVLHVAGAIKHHVIDKDDTLRRMLPWGK